MPFPQLPSASLSKLTQKINGTDTLICQVCPRYCRVAPGQRGYCGTLTNLEGKMYLTTYGRVVTASLDPIEKKPFRHFRPGSKVYTIALPGCTLACRFCRNWELSQTVDQIDLSAIPYQEPQKVVRTALSLGSEGLAFSYSEPAAGLAYVLDTMHLGHEAGLFNIWHTNGYLTPEAVAVIAKWLDAACIDLKLPDDKTYKQLSGGELTPVLSAAKGLQEAGVWVEVSTPLLAGINNSKTQLRMIADLIKEQLGPETPWHINRGVPGWKMSDIPVTPDKDLLEAVKTGREFGIKKVYSDLNNYQ